MAHSHPDAVIDACFETISCLSGLDTAYALASACRTAREQMRLYHTQLDDQLAPRLVFLDNFTSYHDTRITLYNIKTHAQTKLAPLPIWRQSFAVAVNGDSFYVCGGEVTAPGSESRVVEEYSLKLGVWCRLPDMLLPRCDFASAVVGNELYVVGGSVEHNDNERILNNVESFNLSLKPIGTWTALPSMLSGRASFTSAVFGGAVHVFGGLDGESATLSTVEYFDTNKQRWIPTAPMPTARYFCEAAVIQNRIFVVGGQSDDEVTLGVVEMFDPVIDAWFAQAAMSTPRQIFQLLTLGCRLMAFGGTRCMSDDPDEEEIKLNSVEFFDSVSNTWTVAEINFVHASGWAGILRP